MPAEYVAMRDKFKSEGLDDAAAKTKAAKIYNSRHPGAPVTRNEEKPMKTFPIPSRPAPSGGEDNDRAGGNKAYAKGGPASVGSYAMGGPVLGRSVNFMKTPDQFRDNDGDDVTGEAQPTRKPRHIRQAYGKSGAGKEPNDSGEVTPPKEKMNKSLSPVKPRS